MLYSILPVICAFLSSSSMLIVALITPLGPWIEPVVIVVGIAFMRLVNASFSPKNHELLVACTVASGVAGIVSVSCAFTLPTLFFLDGQLPVFYGIHLIRVVLYIVFLLLVAGTWAFLLVDCWRNYFLESKKFTFPAVTAMHILLNMQESSSVSRKLAVGGSIALAWQALLVTFKNIPVNYVSVFYSSLAMWPLLGALGFMAGAQLAFPLLLGLFTKYTVFDFVHKRFFSVLKIEHFLAAWCSGSILASLFICFLTTQVHKKFYKFLSEVCGKSFCASFSFKVSIKLIISFSFLAGALLLLGFSFLNAFYIILATAVCAYQLISIAGQTGLAPLGRFATFVMLPNMLLFGGTSLQITVLVLLVELIGGLAVNCMFGRKLADATAVSHSVITKFQLLGLLVSACTIALAVVYLADAIQLGTEPFLAQRAYARAMLIKAPTLDMSVVMLGFVYGVLVHFCTSNTALVVSGLLMHPLALLPLIGGALFAKGARFQEGYYGICAGVFASTSILLLIYFL